MIFRTMFEEYLRNKNHPKMALIQNISISMSLLEVIHIL